MKNKKPECAHDFVELDKFPENSGSITYAFFCRYCLHTETRTLNFNRIEVELGRGRKAVKG